MNTPNKLSLLRIALIPVMVVLLYLAHRSADEVSSVWFILATVVFAGASFTDYLDGHLARKNDQITDFGKFLDPVADKLLVLSAFIMLIQPGLMLFTRTAGPALMARAWVKATSPPLAAA